MRRFFTLAALVAVALMSGVPVSQATVLISDDFDVDSSGDYTVLASADGTETFAYDYSADGIPAAPGSATTIGLKFTSNDTAGAADASTIFHNTPVVGAPDFVMTVDVYMAVQGTGGTTEHAHVGVAGDGATKNTLFNPIDGSGHFIGFTGEGGSSSDFRHANPASSGGLTNSGDPSYLNSANTTNATGDTYQAIFQNPDYPFAGSPGNNWATLSIRKTGNSLVYSFNGTPIILTTYDDSDGNLVSLGYGDLFGSSVANPFQSQFVIYDNLEVRTLVPEPSSLVLLSLGGLALVRRRR